MTLAEIARGVFEVAGPETTFGDDACAYLAIFGGAAALIDAGCEDSASVLISNIERLLAPYGARLTHIILTHNHIDHIGGAAAVKQRFGASIYMHELDAWTLETGDPASSAADWYGCDLRPATVDVKIGTDEFAIQAGDGSLKAIHTPGHTPGSISVLMERDSHRILFGQDIHGPFFPQFKSDKSKWRESMHKLLALECDILCEGHYGVVRPANKVAAFIQSHLREN